MADPSSTETISAAFSSLGTTKGSSSRRNSASREGLKRSRITTDRLNDLAQDPQRIPTFALSLKVRSKSAKCFEEESKDSRKESKKQAWAPKPKQNLFSSSSEFQRHGSVEDSMFGSKGGTGHRKEKEFGRAEDHIYLADLVKLREIFKEADNEGDGTIHLDEFVLIFKQLFAVNDEYEEKILSFFDKIDYNCDGYISWSDFCTYMQLELQERDDVAVNSKKVDFQLPAKMLTHIPHKDSVCRISHLNDGMMVTCSQDGVLCFWSHDYKPRRIRKAEYGLTGKPKWVTDMALCKSINKILLTTGDHEIQFYEMMNFEPYCQLRKLDSLPLRVAFWSNPKRSDECIILIGDNEGTVTVITTSNIREAFKYWKRGSKTENGMPTYPVDKLISDRIAGTFVHRWKLHRSNFLVSEVRYIASLRCLVSSSCDPLSSVVMGSPSGSTPVESLLQSSWQPTLLERTEEGSQDNTTYAPRPKTYLVAKNRCVGDHRVFRVPKGVSTLDFCSKNELLVTGGLDQIIRLWNPYITSKPVAKIYGQSSPVFSLYVDSSNDRIYSIGNDNTVKVWHLLDHACIFTLIPSLHKVSAAVECFYFNPLLFSLVLATDQVAVLKMAHSQGVRNDIVQSHLQPVTSVKYSHCFNQVVTSCEGAVVKIWDISSGKNTFEFSADMGNMVGIRAMDVDKAGKRVVTGGENGEIKLWNYSNGHCIRILDKGNSLETSDINFTNLNDNKYIIAVGWDRKIHLFPDVPGRHVQHVVKPIEGWSSASTHGHSEDILSVAVDVSNLMATSSFDGEVIVWSVVSCHMLAKLQVPHSDSSTNSDHAMNESRAVRKVLFLERRAHLSKTAATLVASGPCGKIHFWNVYEGTMPMGAFKACQSACITDMVVDETNSILIATDTQGYVDVFNIKNYCIRIKAREPPKKVVMWRAHTQRISSVMLVNRWNTVITGSVDGAVRLWTLKGQYIGTFGQDQTWTLGDPSTYLHPMIPEDVLLDKDGLEALLEQSTLTFTAYPEHTKLAETPVKEKVQEFSETQPEDTMAVTDVGTDEEAQLILPTVAMEVPGYNSAKVGKRLRHLRTHSAIKKDEVKSKAVYGHLACQPLSADNHGYRLQPPLEFQKPSKPVAGIYR